MSMVTLYSFTLPIGFSIPTLHDVQRNEVMRMTPERPRMMTATCQEDEIACGAYTDREAYLAKLGTLDHYFVPSHPRHDGPEYKRFREAISVRITLDEMRELYILIMLKAMIDLHTAIYVVTPKDERRSWASIRSADIVSTVSQAGAFAIFNQGDGLSIQPRIPVSPFHAL